MPNFIHSLDAANVHLLLKELAEKEKVPVYTIHDCFATTPNNMAVLERKVKKTFCSIYFTNEGYLLKNHNNLREQIKNRFEIKIEREKEWIVIPGKDIEKLQFPELPIEFKNKKLDDFAQGLLNSKYFIG
jgi:DNA-directed RNA polymerase